MLDIRLLGPPQVVIDGQTAKPDTRKAIAVLAYLAVEGSATRETITAMLWPEAPPARARGSLRRTLSSLRSAVGAEHVVADRSTLELTGVMTTDLEILETSIATTLDHEHPPTDVCDLCVPHLIKASELYRGDFLEGFTIGGAPDFEHWVRDVGESLREKTGEMRRRLAMGLSATGDYIGAIATVRSWIELDQLHEPAHRLSMLLHAWSGDRPGAVQAYLDFVTILDRELGVPPLELTTELYEAILDEDLPPAPATRRRMQLTARNEPPSKLLGRQAELAVLRGELAESRREGRVVALLGAPWMGKTRMIEDLSAEASESHAVISTRSFEMEKEIPYGVAVQVLSALRDSSVDAGLTIPDWARSELARIDPRFGGADGAVSVDSQGEVRLFEAARECLTQVAAIRPVLLAVDDVQWMDEASDALISYLAHRIDEIPVLLVLARREGDSAPSGIGQVTRGATEILLSPLLPTDLTSEAGDPEKARVIVERTGGVPLLVLESLSDDSAEMRSVLRYMESRLESVDDLGRQILATASVLAGICDGPLLRSTSGRSEDEVVTALEDLMRVGLLREIPDTGGISFTLDSLERLVYGSMTMTRRRLLHRRAAETLVEWPHARSDLTTAAAIATQFRSAGDPRAPVWFHIAGDLARSAYANVEARRFYESAIALGSDDLGALHLGLGELAVAAGDYRTALQDLTTAAAYSDGPELAVINHRLGDCFRLQGRFSLAIEYYERSMEEHPHPGDLYSDWSLLALRMDEPDRATELSRKAIESVAAEHGVQLSRAHNVAAVVAGAPQDSLDHLERALELAGEDQLARMAALNNKAYALGSLDRFHEAIPLVGEAIELAHGTGFVHREAVLKNHLADLYHRVGDVESSRAAQVEAMRLFSDVSGDSWQPEVWLLRQW